MQEYRIKLYSYYLELLTRHLNWVHGESHDRSYWELIIGPWLSYFICYTHYRYQQKDSPKISKEPINNYLVPYDYLSFNYMFEKTPYVSQLDYLLLNEAKLVLPSSIIKFDPIQWSSFKKKIIKIAAWVSQRLLNYCQAALFAPYISLKSQLKIILLARFRILPLFFGDLKKKISSANPHLRKWDIKLDQEFQNDEFAKKLSHILLIQIPYVHLEGYQAIKAQALAVPRKVKALFSSTGWLQAEPFKIFAALGREKGMWLVGNQHGGLYGFGDSWFVEYEERITDFFLTWGWQGSLKAYPFYSLKLAEVVNKFEKMLFDDVLKKNILYVTTSGSRHWPDGYGSPSGEQFASYLDWQVLFLKGINESTQKQTVVRLFPGDNFYGWNQKARLESHGVAANFYNEDPYVEALAKAKLVISDNNFTTVLASYACNVPTILFFNKNLWPIHQRALSLLKDMESVGLFHSTPESAAQHTNKIAHNPKEWWNSPSVVPIRQKFRETFARTSPQVFEKLVRFLTAKNLKKELNTWQTIPN